MKISLTCPICKKEFIKELRYYNKLKNKSQATCSFKCMGKMKSLHSCGKNNPFFGKKHSEETRKQISKKTTGRIGYWKDKKLSKETKLKISNNHADVSGKNNPMYDVHRFGENAPNWKDGLSKHKYPSIFVHVRKEILKRDNFTCQECKLTSTESKKKYGKDLEVHHIKSLSADGDDTVENSIALCPNCHRQAHYGKKSY